MNLSLRLRMNFILFTYYNNYIFNRKTLIRDYLVVFRHYYYLYNEFYNASGFYS